MNRPRRLDLKGQRFTKLLVLSKADRKGSRGEIYWTCECDCGRQLNVVANALRLELTKSCGCLSAERSRKHGMDDTPTYWAWAAMKQRCGNKNVRWYHRYGGRGITVCDRWARSFEAFLEDMGEKPDGLALGRINNDGNYEPSNCRWESAKQQIRNRNVSPIVEFRGEKASASELAERFGLSHRRVADRLRRGYSAEDAVKPSLRHMTWEKRRAK